MANFRPSGGCSFGISPTSTAVGSASATGAVAVTATSGCPWTAASNDAWITVTSGATGIGDGTVNYSVTANTTTSQRIGTMTIAGQTFTVTQAGCSVSLSPTSITAGVEVGAGTSSVTAVSSCAWTAVSNDGWITVTGGASGTGNGTVSYSVAANTTMSQRVGTITIGGQTFTVTQASTTFTDDPLMAGTPIKAVHIFEIRARINTLRDACLPALGAYAFTDVTLAGIPAKAVHVTEPRTALSEAYVNCGQAALTFASVVATGVEITTAPITELRMLIVALEALIAPIVVQQLQVSRFTTSSLTDTDADQILADGTSVLQTNDGPGDVSCNVELSRSGGVTTFATGDGSIDSSAEFSAVNGLPGNVKVVNQINWCGALIPNVIGCAPVPGASFVVVRFTQSLEGILWDHEYGHNKGLGHSAGGNAVMNGTIGSTHKRVTQSECDAFLQ